MANNENQDEMFTKKPQCKVKIECVSEGIKGLRIREEVIKQLEGKNVRIRVPKQDDEFGDVLKDKDVLPASELYDGKEIYAQVLSNET